MKAPKLLVEVTLVSVRGLVESDDQRGSVLEGSTWPWLVRLISHAVAAGTTTTEPGHLHDRECSSASCSMLKDGIGEEKSMEIETSRFWETSVRRDVFKFVQVKDRYMSLVSLLLKSRAYHQFTTCCFGDSDTAGSASTARGQRKALVVLPRTPHGKPYLPMPSSNAADRFTVKPFQFNVSHQYPVVGIARLSPCSQGLRSSSSDIGFGSNVQIGFDVVMFDPYPSRLYLSAVEFVEAFRDKLTCAEWEHLMGMASRRTELLREFYLHWAIKEAYTKAIGVGLGFDFSSLCVRFTESRCSTGNISGSSNSSRRSYGEHFASVVTSCAAPTLVPATVHLLTEDRAETWRVALHPIFYNETNRAPYSHGNLRSLNDAVGCFCVFVSESDVSGSEQAEVKPELDVDWLDLDDLVHFHTALT